MREILMRSVSFGYVVPKLAELVEEGMLDGPLIHKRAIDWDVETLSEEQHLVQRLYDALSESDLQDLYDIAELGLVALIGDTFTLTMNPWTFAHLFNVSVLHVDAMWVNYTANRYTGSKGPAQTYSL